ncbi:predicted protein [Uncinocarpus reesii 1704]|uniref:NACHT domain-containing protein n=1 Tax=Uncinocarpus reesii (strain UAMH 1704) TaxID=336963 RepID=C4JYI5_UNCRE|nr:uncharacterized protein UREG_07236 [Uncinocarpus reesii 1704]EEP82371.1 predicted protein [Uncinocarpus reesii 1704]
MIADDLSTTPDDFDEFGWFLILLQQINKPTGSVYEADRRIRPLSFIERRRAASRVTELATDSPERVENPLGLTLLHEPLAPHIDLIFVHGIGGGSQKTWNISNAAASYWPKEWLPHEEGFEHARIYTYGYDSRWAGKGHSVNIHDFGRALLADICDYSHVQKTVDAYLLARDDPTCEAVLKRIRGMIFLGTPHRGADSVHLLKSLLYLPGMHGSKAFVDELVPNSAMLQDINDAFRHTYQGIYIRSYFERIETDLGFSRQIIVERDSAIMGLPSEQVRHLDTDHRHLAKFTKQSDANYKTLCRGLLAAMATIEKNHTPIPFRDNLKAELKIVAEYLSDTFQQDNELAKITENKTEGSCEWLINRTTFRDWFAISDAGDHNRSSEMSNSLMTPKLFWLSGKPGTGKTIVSGHVAQYIKSKKLGCSVYFFKRGNRTKSSVCHLLRSFAFQMACSDSNIRQLLLRMASDGEDFDSNDPNSIWRALYLSRILRTNFQQPHYWVIDALDECDDYAALIRLLSNVGQLSPLRVFATNRSVPETENELTVPVFAEQMSLKDSLEDIERFLRARMHFLQSESNFEGLLTQIVSKSNGCFLWAALVLTQLQRARRLSTIQSSIDLVPVGMNDLYKQILDNLANTLSSDVVDKMLAKAIFRWSLCTIRPLTLDEFKDGLYFDVLETPRPLRTGIESYSGHLIYLDDDSRIQPVHQTVGAFLTNNCPVSDFAMEKKKEHARIAEVCLSFLSGKEFYEPQTRQEDTPGLPTYLSPFAKYAIAHFSDHIFKSSSQIDSLLVLLSDFLESPNVLAWIEGLAQAGNITLLAHTAKNLKSFLARRAKYLPPLGREVQIVEAWIHDLIHIGALFAHNLVAVPKSVHFLVPPLCPRNSAIYSQFGDHPGCLKAVGIIENNWDDRLTSFSYADEETMSVACGTEYFAVGLSDGTIVMYRSTTCKYIRTLKHPGAVGKLSFANLNPLLASCSTNKLVLWNTHKGDRLWTFDRGAHLVPMALGFNHDDSTISLATRNGVSVFQASDGKITNSISYSTSGRDNADVEKTSSAWFSPSLDIVAIASRNRPMTILNMVYRTREKILKEGYEKVYDSPHVNAVAFHPNSQAGLVAVAYNDGDLVVHKFLAKREAEKFPLLCQTLAVSPDGRTLATGDSYGTIHLFNFETLRLSYRITSDSHNIQAIAFNSSGLRFFDIRANRCNVWEPSILVVRETSDDTSTEPCSEEMLPPMQHKNARHLDDDRFISAITGHQEDEYLFCGRFDGSIAVYETETGNLVHELCKHMRFIRVHLLDWNADASLLTSADVSCRFICRGVARKPGEEWSVGNTLLDKRTSSDIKQILTNQRGDRLLVSTALTDVVYTIDAYSLEINRIAQQDERQWIKHPTNADHLVLIKGGKAFIYDWAQFTMVSGEDGIHLESLSRTDHFVSQIVCNNEANKVGAFYLAEYNERDYASELELWDAANITPDATRAPSEAQYKLFPHGIKAILGEYMTFLLFLDSESWVCSVDLESTERKDKFAAAIFLFLSPGTKTDTPCITLPPVEASLLWLGKILLFSTRDYGFKYLSLF